MAMSDCIECWDTPCSCGYGYRNMGLADKIKLASAVLGINPYILRNFLAGNRITDCDDVILVSITRTPYETNINPNPVNGKYFLIPAGPI